MPRPIAGERSATWELSCWYAALGETTAIPDFIPAETTLATVVSANATYIVHWPEQQRELRNNSRQFCHCCRSLRRDIFEGCSLPLISLIRSTVIRTDVPAEPGAVLRRVGPIPRPGPDQPAGSRRIGRRECGQPDRHRRPAYERGDNQHTMMESQGNVANSRWQRTESKGHLDHGRLPLFPICPHIPMLTLLR